MVWNARELDELTVWADARQAEGDGLGELVALSLAADQVGASGEVDKAEALRQRGRELCIRLPDAALRTEIGQGRPGLLPTWRHGLLVALRINDDMRQWPEAEDFLRRVLQAPLARELRYLEVSLRNRSGFPLDTGTLALLADPRCVAEPRIVVIGAHPSQMSDVRWTDRPLPERVRALETGPWGLFVHGKAVRLPLVSGGRRARYRVLDAAAQRMFATRERASRLDMTTLARGLGDPSMRVYKRTLTKLVQHGAVTAPLLPLALLQKPSRGPRGEAFGAFVEAMDPDAALTEALVADLMTNLLVRLDRAMGRFLPFGEGRCVTPSGILMVPSWRPFRARLARTSEAIGLHGPGIDINSCPVWALEQTYGITRRLARQIDARRAEKPFESIEELCEVGLDPSVLESISDLVTVYRRQSPGLDPNAASDRQLRALPGIGPVYAARIRAHRPYTNLEQLRRRVGLPRPTTCQIARYLEWPC